MEVFGITGTNGKTTASYMLDYILSACGYGCALVGTVKHRIGENTYEAVNTTPGRELFEKYREEARNQGLNVLITEVSSHALAQGRLEGTPVKYAAFTNLSRDHMDYHKSMEEYYLAKRKLFDFKTVSSAIINIDDEYGRRLYKELGDERPEVRRISVSLEDNTADYFADIKREGFSGTEFEVMADLSDAWEFFLPQPGHHNVYDSLIATALAMEKIRNDSLETAAGTLEGFGGAPGRFEIIRGERGGVSAVCDYAHTPDALENLLTTVKEVKDNDSSTQAGRIITVFGCGGDRDKGKRPEMGRIAGSLSDYTIITSDNPRTEDPLDIIGQIEAGIRDVSERYAIEPDREKAINRAVMLARPGDVIVVAGKGHEDYQIIGLEKKRFDDREILRELLL